ncbi:MAG: hypothetical protein CL677_03365 [Bdellovibrionaceae bacterium]|nr:hypothetical protein [Pseudobdellovibrionaceae bacterium]|tara:strand:- start:66 stop:683 length:618 start_codon:yes stop_codon:yes gene_type:complete
MKNILVVALLSFGLMACDKGGSKDSCSSNAEIVTIQTYGISNMSRNRNNRIIIPNGTNLENEKVEGFLRVKGSGEEIELPTNTPDASNSTDIEQAIDFNSNNFFAGNDAVPFNREDDLSKASGEDMYVLNEKIILDTIRKSFGSPDFGEQNVMKFCSWTSAEFAFYEDSDLGNTLQFQNTIKAAVQISEEGLFQVRQRSNSIFQD